MMPVAVARVSVGKSKVGRTKAADAGILIAKRDAKQRAKRPPDEDVRARPKAKPQVTSAAMISARSSTDMAP